jgi:FecR-like protein
MVVCIVAGAAAAHPAPVRADIDPGAVLIEAGSSGGVIKPLQLAQAAPPQSLAPPAQTPAAPTQQPLPPTTTSIGTVTTVQGSATVTRDGATTALKPQDEIFKGDSLKTGANASLGVTFDDETTFSLTANASITVDDLVYQDGGNKNSAAYRFVQGTVAFVAGAVAKTGNMSMTTPSASLGIRGTTGLIEVGPQGSATPAAAAGNDAIKLYPDADGKVGRIEITGRDGASLGVLSRGATGFSIQRGAGGARAIATPLQISPQQAARDQGLVRQVYAAQRLGRNIVAQRRDLRQRGITRPAPQRQAPGVQRPGAQRPGLPGVQRPGVQRPGLQRPAPRRPAPPPQRGKKRK